MYRANSFPFMISALWHLFRQWHLGVTLTNSYLYSSFCVLQNLSCHVSDTLLGFFLKVVRFCFLPVSLLHLTSVFCVWCEVGTVLFFPHGKSILTRWSAMPPPTSVSVVYRHRPMHQLMCPFLHEHHCSRNVYVFLIRLIVSVKHIQMN